MKTTQDQAFKRLLKKLSAMRATLRNDEREILDAIVTGEVEAHKLSVDKAADKAAGKAAGKAAEVAAHKLSVDKAADKAAGKAADKAAEVAAHKLSVDKAADKAAGKAAGRVIGRIAIDPANGQYTRVRD